MMVILFRGYIILTKVHLLDILCQRKTTLYEPLRVVTLLPVFIHVTFLNVGDRGS